MQRTMYSWKLIRKIMAMVFAGFVLIFILYPFIVEEPSKDCQVQSNIKCEKGALLLNGFSTPFCVEKMPIFFVETSKAGILSTRQACAIESSALHNPLFQVYVLMTSSKPIDFSNDLMRNLVNISNIQIIQINIDEFFCGSPVWNWYISGKWKNSKWKASHLSDALRFFLVWKYGGIYLDMDVVVLRSIQHLKNTVITENWDRVASGILIFDKGHELMRRCMFDFAENYDPFNFVANGPGIITRNIRAYCDISDIGKVSGANCNIDIKPPEAAFPIPYDKWEKYFIPFSTSNACSFNSSYLIHVWNKYSKSSKLIIGQKSLYELAMQKHCPLAFKQASKLGYA